MNSSLEKYSSDSSPIFRSVAVIVFFIVNLFALYLLFRGHNFPGGGFIAGVCTAIALILLSFGMGLEAVQKILHADPVRIAVFGMLLATLSGCVPLFFGDPYLTTYNYKAYGLPVIGDFYMGTPLVFDIGVYLAVVGVICKVVFVIAESTRLGHEAVRLAESGYAARSEEPIEENPLIRKAPYKIYR